jgi:hypothetical protein
MKAQEKGVKGPVNNQFKVTKPKSTAKVGDKGARKAKDSGNGVAGGDHGNDMKDKVEDDEVKDESGDDGTELN